MINLFGAHINSLSIHRVGNAERIRVQKISDKGEVIGEYRFVGLFTSAAYSQSPSVIPLVKDKISKLSLSE